MKTAARMSSNAATGTVALLSAALLALVPPGSACPARGECRAATAAQGAVAEPALLAESVPLDARGFPRRSTPRRSTTPRHPSELTFPEMTFKLPPMEKATLDNGLKVILIRRPDLPILAMELTVKMCNAYLPPDKHGLCSVLTSVWRSGGSTNWPPERLDSVVETLGGTLSIYATSEYVGISLKFLSRDAETATDILADLILNPSFPQDRIELVKSQELDSIRRRQEDPARLISLAGRLVLYGSGHPYGRLLDSKALSAITRDDLLRAHSRFVRPNNAVLAVAGDFDNDRISGLLRDKLGSWEPRAVVPPKVPPQAAPDTRVVTLVPSQGGNCFVRLVQPLRTEKLRGDPAVDVANVIVGYYRLFSRLRMQEGLTYSVYTRFTLRDYGGGFTVDFECAPSDLCKAIDTTLEVLNQCREQTITTEELQHGKDFYTNAAPFLYDSVEELASVHSWLELRGRPMDFYKRRFERLSALTVEDVGKIVKRYVRPKRMALVVVAPPSDITCDLSKYGRVRQVSRVEDLQEETEKQPYGGNASGQAGTR